MISIFFSAFAPLLVVAVTVTVPPAGTSAGAVYLPSEVMAPALAPQVTVGESLTTFAESCTLEPACMLAGAPSIETAGWVEEVTSIETVATCGLSGNLLAASAAENVKLSVPVNPAVGV